MSESPELERERRPTAGRLKEPHVRRRPRRPRPRRRLVALRRIRSPRALPDLIADVTMLAVAMAVTEATAPTLGLANADLLWLLAFPAVVLTSMWAGGSYRERLAPDFLERLRVIVSSTAVAAMTLTFTEALFGDGRETAEYAARAWVISAVYLAAGRGGLELFRRRARREGHLGEPALIAGAGQVGRTVASRLLARPGLGIRPVAYLDDAPLPAGGGPDLPVIGFEEDRPGENGIADRLEYAVREYGARHLIMTFSLRRHDAELEIVRTAEKLGVSVSLVPRLFERFTDRTSLERLGGLPLITVHPSNPKGIQYAFKYTLGRFLAALIVVLASPLLVVLALAVWATMGRPILFRQERIGLDGHPFQMLKFRTMASVATEQASERKTADAMARGEAVGPGGVEGEDRRTPLGKFLRRTSLDELPQLLNVLRGDMSLVGPRPERPEFVREFDQTIYRYGERHRVKSGITGWAQVHGLRGKTSLADRVEWDNYYIENWSLWLDVKILILTVLAVFQHDAE
jgi:exopolysaccharide biosynthesis polyprenyl glycosylphosphotransferase